MQVLERSCTDGSVSILEPADPGPGPASSPPGDTKQTNVSKLNFLVVDPNFDNLTEVIIGIIVLNLKFLSQLIRGRPYSRSIFQGNFRRKDNRREKR